MHGLPAPVQQFVNVHETFDMLGTPKESLAHYELAQKLQKADWQMMARTQTQLHQLLQKGEAEHTMGRIMALLAHFFITPLPEKLHSAVFRDWLSVLAPYPNWAIDVACERWLIHHSKKPFPRDILTRTKEETLPFTRMCEALNLLFQHKPNTQ